MSEQEINQEQNWHGMEVDRVLEELKSGRGGLDTEEAKKRIDRYGLNKMRSEKKKGALQRFLRQFNNVLIYVLIFAAILAAILGKWMDSAVIFAVVLINAVIGFIQEGKAEHAMESIRGMLSPTAKVLRKGQREEIEAEKVVPGDIVLLEPGDRVPADVRVFDVDNAEVNEANLTGESEPVHKQSGPVEEDASLGDRKSMAYSSTIVTSGHMSGVVVATGQETELGHISEMVSGIEEVKTPLVEKIDKFGKELAIAILVLSAALFLFGYFFRSFSAGEMLMIVVGLAVAAIPQGLPAIMTITLALGVQRMAKRKAIMRKLPAVETLGSVTIICSDKTGTLTRNEMTVETVCLAGKTYSVGGTGYVPEGDFTIDDKQISAEEDDVLMELSRAGMLSSNATLKKKDGEWGIDGKPTEGAAVVLAHKAGISQEEVHERYARIDVIPFESERRYMASLHKLGEGRNIVYIKGAPERVLEMCSLERTEQEDKPIDEDMWKQRQEELANGGHRVLAIASKETDSDSLEEDELKEVTLLGLLGIIDPPREEAIDAVAKCQTAGIRVKMITGDHALTARSVASSMGIGDGEHVVAGKDLEGLSDEELRRTVAENDVFARSSPENKLQMIKSLQSDGHIVAMTGDGVNDSPALKKANVGVAMGIKGSEASKQAAEIVLADDNFATIERAVEEGRTIYDNLVKTIIFVLPTNGAESLMVIASAVILFSVMPITPLQILWVNMITAVTLAISLAFEPAEKGIMQRPPRPPGEPIFSRYLLWRIVFVSVLISLASMGHFIYRRQSGGSLEEARTSAVNMLVAGQFFYLFNSRFLNISSISIRGILGNKAALIAAGILILIQLVFTYFGPVQDLFGTADMKAIEWVTIALAGLAIFFVVELEKKILR